MVPVWLSVSLYTGQQLVLEGLGRWLQRPCAETEHARRRTSLRALVVLLLKTAATGVLATVLDAAIEYRRRQLLAAASLERGGLEGDAAAGSSFPGLGALSRQGIAAWKARLLLCIDEMERQAEQYGIEPTRRFGEGGDGEEEAKPEAAKVECGDASVAAAGGGGLPCSGSVLDLAGDERRKVLSRTVEQLRGLVQDSAALEGAAAERRLDDQVGTLLDCLLGGEPEGLPGALDAAAVAAAGCSAAPAVSLATEGSTPPPLPPPGDSPVCQICMDRDVRVEVAGCGHELCYQCARRLCTTPDHSMPQCPFCRQSISGWACKHA